MVEANTKAQAPRTGGQRQGGFQRGAPGQRGPGGPGGQRGKFQRGRPQRRQPVVEEKIWVPKTKLGKQVAEGKITDVVEVLKSGQKIMEEQITEKLVPSLDMEFINVGQAKGKFGGGKRKPSRSTQKITREGSVMSFSMIAVCGNKDGVVGLGFGKARETVPSREKAVVNAKKNLIVIRRGAGSWGSFGAGSTTIPFTTEGKSGSVKVKLIPAPKGTGLVVEAELKKMLELAGIKDVWSKTFGSTKNKSNLMKAGFDALANLQKMRLQPSVIEGRNIKEGDKDEF